MKNREQFVLKAFLSHCSDEKKEALEKFLPERELDLLKKIPSIDKPDQIEVGSLIDIVHWSWFIEILKNHSETEQKLLLQALPPYAAKNLAKSLTLTSTQETLHNVTKKYLQSFLIGSLIGPHNRLLPKEFLPPSPLKPLLNLSKNKLTELIDFLALHDLAYDLRQIVETKILKKIYSLLSEEERQFLKNCMSQKESFSHSKMGLDRWDGSEEMLRVLLHKKGLARLGAALSGESTDLIWYICHFLDIGRGSLLLKLCQEEPIAGVTELIVKQIEELL